MYVGNATLEKEFVTAYISEAEVIKFIEANSDMEWNTVCDYVRKEKIVSVEYGRCLYVKTDLLDPTLTHFTKAQRKWMLAFFEAHPFLPQRIMLVFDD